MIDNALLLSATFFILSHIARDAYVSLGYAGLATIFAVASFGSYSGWW